MLVLSRRVDESIVIDGGIRITLLGIKGHQARLGIEAPGQTKIFREELLSRAETETNAEPVLAGGSKE